MAASVRHVLRRHGVGQAEQHHVDAAGRLGRRDPLEDEVGELLQLRVGRRERLADEVDRGDADELDVGVDEEPPGQLGAAVARSRR